MNKRLNSNYRRNIKSVVSKLIYTTATAIAAIVFMGIFYPHGIAPEPKVDKEIPQPNSKKVDTLSMGQYGIAGGGSWVWQSPAEQQARMDGLADLGITWLRLDMAWSAVQPNNATTYSWNTYDNVVRLASAKNIKIIFIVNYTPQWARLSDCVSASLCRPADPATYAKFVAEAAKRYSPQGVHTWEIWNEQNKQAFWRPAPDPVAYAKLLAAAYPAIKSQDSTATVLSGGLGSISTGMQDTDPRTFLTQMYANGAQPYFDALSDHPYSYPVLPSYGAQWNAWQQLGNISNSLRNIMVANGDAAKKIWITEFGAPTGGPGPVADAGSYLLSSHPNHVTEALQSAIMNDALSEYRSQTYFGPFLWYSYKDEGTATGTIENFFGLIRADGSHKPAYDTYKYLIKGSI